ncbi:50S ribosomal subunit L30 [Pluteus cervinus]|uniref:50S ribosomal subunit L30 n=1 Tax=Pluteus cervinus TaxID=181527 RepID=A0ACD3AQ81_9AGAR|nr:50S ribosomal subunit L30 [Pluteus cervinus]
MLSSLTLDISRCASRLFATESLPARPQKYSRSQLQAAVILNRSPILTRTPSEFERAYYAYQSRIRRTLHNPFPYDFYFKQGSLLETRFNLEEHTRERRAFGQTFAPKDKLHGSAENGALVVKQEGEDEILLPRVHPSDTSMDIQSLDRRGRRNLYLLLQTDRGWQFPQGDVKKGELLHQAAQRDLFEECGPHMDTWIVSRNPIGVLAEKSLNDPPEVCHKMTFFFKAHILAGQVRLQGASSFAWLTKEEIQERVSTSYWTGTKDMLSDH